MGFLQIFISILSLFVIGALFGWILEVFYRRIFTAKKWINPGFLVGPYLPIYGFAVVALYGLSNINFILVNNTFTIIAKVLMISLSITLLEFIGGLIFIKGMKIKLWDYSNQKGNFLGIICPLYSFMWLIISFVYYFLINPYLVQAVYWLSSEEHQIYYFFVGTIVGMILVDFAYSTHLATEIRKLAKKYKTIVNFNNFKQYIKEKSKKLLPKKKKTSATLDEHMKDYLENKN